MKKWMNKIVLLLILLLVFVAVASAQLTYNNLIVNYDSAWTYSKLMLIPIKFKNAGYKPVNDVLPNTGCISVPEAMQRGKIKVREIRSEDGSDVNWLEVVNESKQAILLNSGEMLGGGKQDRIIGETKILLPGTSDYVHVYCIERGRWDDKPKGFTYGSIANIELRKVMDVTGRQQEVWKEIRRQYENEQKTSETWPFLKLYNRQKFLDTAYTNFFTKKFNSADSAYAGFIAVTGNRIICCELFSSTDFTRVSYPGFLTSMIETVLLNGGTPAIITQKIKAFADQLLTDELSQKTFIEKHGKIDRYQGHVIHLIAYN